MDPRVAVLEFIRLWGLHFGFRLDVGPGEFRVFQVRTSMRYPALAPAVMCLDYNETHAIYRLLKRGALRAA